MVILNHIYGDFWLEFLAKVFYNENSYAFVGQTSFKIVVTNTRTNCRINSRTTKNR